MPNEPDGPSWRSIVSDKFRNVFTTSEQQLKIAPAPEAPPPSLLRSITNLQAVDGLLPAHTQAQQRYRLARRAFLRHSFNRLDFVAVVSFWITFFLTLTQLESQHHLYVFRMLSCLRILRLLGITSGTGVRAHFT